MPHRCHHQGAGCPPPAGGLLSGCGQAGAGAGGVGGGEGAWTTGGAALGRGAAFFFAAGFGAGLAALRAFGFALTAAFLGLAVFRFAAAFTLTPTFFLAAGFFAFFFFTGIFISPSGFRGRTSPRNCSFDSSQRSRLAMPVRSKAVRQTASIIPIS